MLAQFPGGLLADRFGRKRIIVYCTAAQIVAPLSFLFANTWQQLIPGIIFDSIAWGLYSPARQALIAESLPHQKRGAAYGVFRTITSIPRIFLPLLSGILMDQVGVINGVRIGFILTIAGHIVMTIARGLMLRETLFIKVEAAQHSSLKKSFSGLISLRGSVLAMLIVAILSSFLVRMTQPFLVVYAVEIVTLTKTQWGLMETIIGAISTILAFPSGIISDRFGRRLPILLARFLLPFNRLILLFIRSFSEILFLHILVGIGTGLGGEAMGSSGAMGGPAWNALLADLIPSKDRGKIMGLMSMITGLATMPASIMGGYIWANSSPEFLLASTFLTGMVPVLIFYIFVKEPKNREI
jgi:MFS family permease